MLLAKLKKKKVCFFPEILEILILILTPILITIPILILLQLVPTTLILSNTQ